MRITPLTLLLSIILACLTGCSGDNEVSPQDISRIKTFRDIPGITDEEISAIEMLKPSRQSFSYGTMLSTEMFLSQHGIYSGFTVMLNGLLSDLFGIPFVLEIFEWEDLYYGLRRGSIDFTGELTPTFERQKEFHMTHPIAERSLIVVHKEGTVNIEEINKLNGLKIGFLTGTITAQSVRRIYNSLTFEIIDVHSERDAAEKLLTGEMDLLIIDSVNSHFFEGYDFTINGKVLSLVYTPVSLATANPELAPIISAVDKFLAAGGRDITHELHNTGDFEYQKFELWQSFTDAERNFITGLAESGAKVPVALEHDLYPVCFYRDVDKEFQGIAPDILKEISFLTGLEFEVINDKDASFSELLEMLSSGRASLVSELKYTEERQGKFLWPDEPYFVSYYAFLSRIDRPYLDFYQVPLVSTGVHKGTAFEEMYRTWFPDDENLAVFESQNDALDALENGEIELLLTSDFTLLYQMNYREKTGYKINILLDSMSSSSFFGLNRDQEELRSIINKTKRFINLEKIVRNWAERVYDYERMMAEQRAFYFFVSAAILTLLLIFLIILSIRNSRTRKLLEKERERIAYQNNLLETVNKVSSALLELNTGSFENTLQKSLDIMSGTVDVDRICIWENRSNETAPGRNGVPSGSTVSSYSGTLGFSLIYQWENGGFSSRIANGVLAPDILLDEHPMWKEILLRGDCINSLVRDMPPSEQAELTPRNIVSLFVVPVFLGEHFWGYIGLDDCRKERIFTESEEIILLSTSRMIANALIREEMTQNILYTSAQLDEANRAKSDFLARMSHEIRTPMNAITGMIKIGKSSNDSERKDYCFNRIDDASQHLLGVINDVLDVSKIEAGEFQLSLIEFNFEKMLQRVINVVKFRSDEKKISLSVHIDKAIPKYLIGDDQRLAQVITNLVGNAVKFTPQDGLIDICTRLLDEETVMPEGHTVCGLEIRVVDTGIGISPDQQATLFQSYKQADSSTARKFGGTGLGLVISKNLIEMMGGRIWIESELGKGAAFVFTVHLLKGTVNLEGANKQGINWSNVRILAVDDDSDILEYFEGITQGLGVSCEFASSAEDALRLVRQNGSYNIYFIDWKMPDIDGIELAKTLNNMGPALGGSVVVLISAAEFSDIADEAKAAGVHKYIQKPLFPSYIADAVNEYLGESGHRGDRDQHKTTCLFEGSRILVAEDVEINREIVQSILEPTLLVIDFAENGVIAVRMFSESPEKYDMIFMDIQMPEMDGYEATRVIRSLDIQKAKDIPIIAMTANVFKEDVEKCIECGMNGHVGKPIDFDELIEQLQHYLKYIVVDRRGGEDRRKSPDRRLVSDRRQGDRRKNPE